MAKFKVGDIVAGTKEGDYRYGVADSRMLEGVVTRVDDHPTIRTQYISIKVIKHLNSGLIGQVLDFVDARYFTLVKSANRESGKSNRRVIVIAQDGLKTVAVEKCGKEVVKKAIARCNPSDEYKWEIGAQLAYNRLMYGTDYHPSEVALHSKEQYYTGAVVCTFSRTKLFRQGSLYYIKNGKMCAFNEDGMISRIRDVESLNESCTNASFVAVTQTVAAPCDETEC